MENTIVVEKGTLTFMGKSYPCVVGKGGVVPAEIKQEGDGACTPAGTYPLRMVYYRPDRISGLSSGLPLVQLNDNDGWCDDVTKPQYNQHVTLPFTGSHENLWRPEDGLYDIIVVIGYNDDPVVPGKGSAIFLHVARPEMTPTGGCVAVSEVDLREVVAQANPDTKIDIRL